MKRETWQKVVLGLTLAVLLMLIPAVLAWEAMIRNQDEPYV